MNVKIIFNKYAYLMFLVLGLGTIIGCQPNDSVEGNGLSDSNVDASFTITPVEGVINTYLLESQTTNVIASKWDIGEGSYIGKMKEEIYLPDAGTYTITHTSIGRGGESNSLSKELIVAESDPVAGNLLKGSKFESVDDYNEWTILNISASGAAWSYVPGYINISGGGWSQQGIYQAVEVQANKNYKIDMKVWGDGSSNTWFEVYVSKTAPVQNSDYSGDVRMQLNTWAGCATSAFTGKLSAVGCGGSGNVVNFSEAGTVYIIIKCGGENIGSTGINVDNVEFRGSL